jgi:chromosome segregation ATPase
MTDRTKLILAITLGSVGLALGILGTIVAFNTKNEVRSDREVSAVVNENFAEAQKRQDELEARQASEAEKLVNSLSASERGLIRRINGNIRAVGAIRKRLNRQERQIKGLESLDQQLSGEIASLQRQVTRNQNEVNDRVDRLNQRVTRLQVGGVGP